MGRQLIIAIVALTGLNLGPLGSGVKADTAEVWCFTQQQGQWPTNTKPCGFSQRQGNVRIDRDGISYLFRSDQQGQRYERIATQRGLTFRSPTGLIQVFWERPCSEWKGCAGDP